MIGDKKLILIRHAKSDLAEPALMDRERQLTERGLQDASFMADWLREAVGRVDIVYSSPAKRAQQTANVFIEALEPPTTHMIEKLYDADIEDIINVINSIPSVITRAVLIGHNPGLTHTAEYLTQTTLHNIPTCGIVVMDMAVDEWSEAGRGTAIVTIFSKPKEIRD